MTILEVKVYFYTLLSREKIEEAWTIEVDSRLRAVRAKVDYNARVLALSKQYLENHSEEEMKQTLCHEVAHIPRRRCDHDSHWREAFNRLLRENGVSL